jgi:hypothetical protein
MSERNEEQPAYDPSLAVLDFYDSWTRSWSETMSQAVANRGLAELMGWQVSTAFGLLAWTRRQIGGLVTFSLRQLNMPTRSEVLALGERLTRLEMALDDLDAKLDDMRDHFSAAEGTELPLDQ